MRLSPFSKRAVLALALLLFGFFVKHVLFEHYVGIDFYQYWGVGLGPQLSDGALKSPYAEISKYAAFLDSYSNKSDDPYLHTANRASHFYNAESLDIPGTPLLYAMFKFMPQNYFEALKLFLSIKIVAFTGAMVMLFSHKKTKWILFLILGLILEGYYDPIVNDFKVGNLGTLQFFALVALTFFCDKVVRTCPARHVYVFGSVFMSFLVFVVLIKPNIALIALLLSAPLWLLRGGTVFAVSTAVAGVAGLLFAAIPCMYFGSWSIWGDWSGYLREGGERLAYSVLKGNTSTPLIISDMLNIGIENGVVLVALLLFAHILWALFTIKPAKTPALKYGKSVSAFLLKDPYFCVSLGIILTLAVSPLVWRHYYTLSLLPALWFIAISPPLGRIEFFALLSLLLSGALPVFLNTLDAPPYLANGITICGWVPLWFGVQSVISDRSKIFLEARKIASSAKNTV